MVNISSHEVELFKGDWFLLPDLFDFMCGKNVGNGNYRSVYECGFDSTLVVKIEKCSAPDKSFGFYNVAEWDVWHNINRRYKEYAKFLAPCIRISQCGRLLLQQKTIPVLREDLPKKIPYFLADTKIENWGKIGKKIVCHDYANHYLFSEIKKKGFVKPTWWSSKWEPSGK